MLQTGRCSMPEVMNGFSVVGMAFWRWASAQMAQASSRQFPVDEVPIRQAADQIEACFVRGAGARRRVALVRLNSFSSPSRPPCGDDRLSGLAKAGRRSLLILLNYRLSDAAPRGPRSGPVRGGGDKVGNRWQTGAATRRHVPCQSKQIRAQPLRAQRPVDGASAMHHPAAFAKWRTESASYQ